MRRGKFFGLSLAAMLAIANMGMTVAAEEAAVAQSTVSDNSVLEIETEEVASEKATKVTVGDFVLEESGTGYLLTDYNGSAAKVDLTTGEIAAYTITGIDDQAFRDNDTLTQIILQNSIESIGNLAFYGCDSLTKCDMPDALTSIGRRAFYSCDALAQCEIPGTVLSIQEEAFYNTALTSVTIPATCIAIGDEAFNGIKTLRSVTFAERTEELAVGTSVFRGCSQLQSANIPAQMTTIPDYFFYGTALSSISIPATCTQIGNYAFYKTKMSEVAIPNSVELVGDYAFAYCENMDQIIFEKGFTVLSIGKQAFRATAIEIISLPDVMEIVSESLFRDCDNLTSVKLPANCSTISDDAFRGCSALPAVTLPEGIESIGGYAFYECDSLTELTVPASCESIGTAAFGNTGNLQIVTFLNPNTTLPNNNLFNNTSKARYLVAEPGAVAEYAAGYTNLHHWRPSKSLVVKSLPAQTAYMYGENFVTDGLVITANFSSQTAPTSATVALEDCLITGYNSKKVGTQTITVSYGNAKTTFNVKVSYDMENVMISTTNVTYTGSPVNTVVTATGWETAMRLKEGVDYTVQYVGDHTNVGIKTIKLIGKGYYAGSSVTVFTIVPKAFSSIRDLKVKADNMEYTGSARKPKVTVSYGSIVISPNDYTVVYENNKNAGTATITITAKNNYTGTAEGTFKVTRKSVKGAKVKLDKSSYAYTKKAIKPKVTVTLDGKELVKGTDYSVTYEKNINVGKGVITIKGKNNYKDTFTKKFTIKVKKGTTFTIGSYKYKVTDATKKQVEFKALAKSSVKNVKIPYTVKIAGTEYKVTSVAEKALFKKTKVKSVTIGAHVTKIGKNAFYGCKNLKKIVVQGEKLKSIGKNALKNVHKDLTLKVPKKKMNAYKKLFKKAMGTKKAFKTTKL